MGEEAVVAHRAEADVLDARHPGGLELQARHRLEVGVVAAAHLGAEVGERGVDLLPRLVAARPRARARSPRPRTSPPSARTPSSTIPAARPRQPPWSIATPRGPASAMGRQSATSTIGAASRSIATCPSASCTSVVSTSTRAPCTCRPCWRIRPPTRSRTMLRFVRTEAGVVVGPQPEVQRRVRAGGDAAVAVGEEDAGAGAEVQRDHVTSRGTSGTVSRWAYSKCARPRDCSVSRRIHPPFTLRARSLTKTRAEATSLL